MSLRAWIDDWEITDRLVKSSATYLRYGFDKKLQKFKQDISALHIYDADGQVEQYLRAHSDAIIKVQDGAFYFEGYPEQQITKHKGAIEVKLQSKIHSTLAIGSKSLLQAGLYTLKDILLAIFPNSSNIDDVHFQDSNNYNSYYKPTQAFVPLSQETSKGDFEHSYSAMLIALDTLVLTDTDHIYIIRRNTDGTLSLDAHIYVPDKMGGQQGWWVRVLGSWTNTSGEVELKLALYNEPDNKLAWVTYNLTTQAWTSTQTGAVYAYINGSNTTTSDPVIMHQAFLTSLYSYAEATSDTAGPIYYANIVKTGYQTARLTVVKVGEGPQFNPHNGAIQVNNTFLSYVRVMLEVYNPADGHYYLVFGNPYYPEYILLNKADTYTTSHPLEGTQGFNLIYDNAVMYDGDTPYILGQPHDDVGVYRFNPFNQSDNVALAVGADIWDVRTVRRYGNRPARIYLNILPQWSESRRGDMMARTAIVADTDGFYSQTYLTGGDTEHPLQVFVFHAFYDYGDSRLVGLAHIDGHVVPTAGAITSDFYPFVALTHDDADKSIEELLQAVIKAGFYAIWWTGASEVMARSLYNADFDNPTTLQSTTYKILRHHILMPYKFLVLNPAYIVAGYTKVKGTSIMGFKDTVQSDFVDDLTLYRYADNYIKMTENKPNIVKIETCLDLQNGDVVKLETANGFIVTGMVVAVERGVKNRYLILGTQTLAADIGTEAPEPSVPVVEITSATTEPQYYGSLGNITAVVQGTNHGGEITKVVLRAVIFRAGQWLEQVNEYVMHYKGDFTVRLPIQCRFDDFVLWFMYFCNAGGCASRFAVGEYKGDYEPPLQDVYALSGKAITTGISATNLWQSIVPNSIMADEDGDGYVDGWHLDGDDVVAATGSPLIGSTYVQIRTTITKTFVHDDFIPFPANVGIGNPADKWARYWMLVWLIRGTGDEAARGEIGIQMYDKDKNYLGDFVVESGISLYGEGWDDADFKCNLIDLNSADWNSATRYVKVYFKVIGGVNIYGLWFYRAKRQMDLRVEDPTDPLDVTTKQYVDNGFVPYAGATQDIDVADKHIMHAYVDSEPTPALGKCILYYYHYDDVSNDYIDVKVACNFDGTTQRATLHTFTFAKGGV